MELQEKEFEKRMALRVLELKIQALENQMVNRMDPFGPEFEAAAEKLQQLNREKDSTRRELSRCRIEIGTRDAAESWGNAQQNNV